MNEESQVSEVVSVGDLHGFTFAWNEGGEKNLSLRRFLHWNHYLSAWKMNERKGRNEWEERKESGKGSNTDTDNKMLIVLTDTCLEQINLLE